MNNLTLRYSITQFTYWAASSGAAAFATTYLLDKGVPSGTVGLLLAMAGLLSCFTQPILASLADKAERFVLTQMLILMSVLCCVFPLQSDRQGKDRQLPRLFRQNARRYGQ